MTHLFIGGPVDGEWRECEEIPTVRIFRQDNSGIREYVYNAMCFSNGFEADYWIYVYSEFTDDVMFHLIKNYKP